MKSDLLRYPLLLCLFAAACSSPQARVMGEDEDDLASGTRAGAETYYSLIKGATSELLQKYTDDVLNGQAPTGLNVAFAGIYNKQREELGEWRDELSNVLQTAVNEYDGFSTVATRFVSIGLREAGLSSADELMVPSKRRTFFEKMETNGNPCKALIYGELTAGSSEVGKKSQRTYRLTLEMIDSETGKNLRADAKLRKEYNR